MNMDKILFFLIAMIAGTLVGCSSEAKKSFQAKEDFENGEQPLCNRVDAQI
jgi:hypothetical protein